MKRINRVVEKQSRNDWDGTIARTYEVQFFIEALFGGGEWVPYQRASIGYKKGREIREQNPLIFATKESALAYKANMDVELIEEQVVMLPLLSDK